MDSKDLSALDDYDKLDSFVKTLETLGESLTEISKKLKESRVELDMIHIIAEKGDPRTIEKLGSKSDTSLRAIRRYERVVIEHLDALNLYVTNIDNMARIFRKGL